MTIPHTTRRPGRSRTAALLASALLLALTGCAGTGAATKTTKSPEEVVLERAVARWEHLINGRYPEAWAMLSPGTRSTRTVDQYAADMSGRPVKWTAVEPIDASCEGEPLVCTTNVLLHYKLRSHVTRVGWIEARAPTAEQWIQSGAQWVHVPKDVLGR